MGEGMDRRSFFRRGAEFAAGAAAAGLGAAQESKADDAGLTHSGIRQDRKDIVAERKDPRFRESTNNYVTLVRNIYEKIPSSEPVIMDSGVNDALVEAENAYVEAYCVEQNIELPFTPELGARALFDAFACAARTPHIDERVLDELYTEAKTKLDLSVSNSLDRRHKSESAPPNRPKERNI